LDASSSDLFLSLFVHRTHSALAARLNENALTFWGDRHIRDYVVDPESTVQLPQPVAACANFFETSGDQVAPDAPATQSFSGAIGEVHCRFSFAELVESKSRTTLILCARRGWLQRPVS
jgi:hypothetical protein